MNVYVDIDADELRHEIGALIEGSDLDAFIDANVSETDDGILIEYPRGSAFLVIVREA